MFSLKNYKKYLPIVLFLLIIIQISLSAYLIYESNTSGYICVVGQNCDYVQNTQYGTMFGIKLAYLAIFAFVFLGIMFFVNRYLFLISTIVGSLFAIYFIIIQLFVLEQICSTCMILDGIMIIIVILAIVNFVVNKNDKKQVTKKNSKSGKKKTKK